MYFDDYAVNYPHDDNYCYGHSNSQTWWADGNFMTHFTWGSTDVNAMNNLGPIVAGAAIGAALGAQGGWAGAAIGALVGGFVAAMLVYGLQNVWIDENNDLHWWSNQGFFHAIHGAPWWWWFTPGWALIEAKQVMSKLTYLRVGNTDYANTNSVVDPT